MVPERPHILVVDDDDRLRELLKKFLREAGVWRVKSELSQRLPATALIGLAFAAAVLLVLPLWIVKYPPLLDYPNHLARVFILTHINDPNYQFSQYYTVTFGPYPYLTMDVLLMGLQKLCLRNMFFS
jgi:CheY-like chemotaxis protein